jgi:hypothetical protein
MYPDMGPGGLLYRRHDSTRWSSFTAAGAQGLEQLSWPEHWAIGYGQGGRDDRAFRGAALSVLFAREER